MGKIIGIIVGIPLLTQSLVVSAHGHLSSEVPEDQASVVNDIWLFFFTAGMIAAVTVLGFLIWELLRRLK